MSETVKMDILGMTQNDDFVEKFKPKKTTDDCYTPPEVYRLICQWAVERYGLEGREIVRPFYPGGDYERFRYPPGCVVLDNPPFSILSRIEAFYLREGIDFFLFAPGLSLFKPEPELGYVVTDLAIRYENGAEVPTSFVTNLGDAWAAAQAKVFALSPREKALVELLGREQEGDGSFGFAQDDRRDV